jgi:hypothetical protein
MRAWITGMDFNNGMLNLSGRAEEVELTDAASLCLRRREIEHGVEYPEEFNFSLNIQGDQFSFEKDINELFRGVPIQNDNIWDMFLLVDDTYTKLEVESSGTFAAKDYVLLDNKLFKAKPYITGEKGVSIYALQNTIKSEAAYASFVQGVFGLSLEVSSDAIAAPEWENYAIKLLIKKREQEKLFEYYETKTFEPVAGTNPADFSLDLNALFEDAELKKNVVWDVFVEVSCEAGLSVEMPLMVANNKKSLYNFSYFNFTHNDLFRIKPYVTGKNNFALFIRSNEINASFTALQFENNKLNIEGVISSGEYEVLNLNELESFLVLKKRFVVGRESQYFTEKVIPLPILNNYFKSDLSLSETFQDEVIRHSDVWDIFIRVTTLAGRTMDVMVTPTIELQKQTVAYELLESNHLFKLKPYINGQGMYSLYFIDSNKNQKDAVKVAVLGSCFSRNPFNSQSYFNPGYKKNYSVALTQFHSSLISIMAKPFTLDVDKLDDVSDYNKQFIVNDFEKNFFELIAQTKPDYLIVDLYADACRDVIKMDEETYVSASLALRQSKYFKNFVEYEVITHHNNDQYFELWTKYMSMFTEKIKEYFPEDRIILNMGGFTYRYKDTDGSTKKFPREHVIQRNNYFWDKLNATFMQNIPGCKVMNLRDTPYIGQHDHPFGNTFSHYQSGYYKEFMNRLNKMVLQDLQKEVKNVN